VNAGLCYRWCLGRGDVALLGCPSPFLPLPPIRARMSRGLRSRHHQEPGLGNIGQAFVDSLTSQLGGRSVDVYAVTYPASDDYHGSSSAGSADASAHIQGTVASCRTPRLCSWIFSGRDRDRLGHQPMPAPVAGHVAAVAFSASRRVDSRVRCMAGSRCDNQSALQR